MPRIRQLLNGLDGDEWREAHPFSEDIKIACEVLLNPYSRDDQRKLAIRGWMTKFQPCVFGKVAAQTDRMFISIVDEELLSRGDQAVKDKLILDRQTWKQWSVGSEGKHGFLLLILSPTLHYASPNQSLRKFAEHIRSLFASNSTPDPVGNDMAYEWLFLKNPTTNQFHKFRVILDFFASAGDGRWWHDHRVPGGVAFTFNSLGHMARTREWYEKNANPVEWAARMAMLTISNASEHPSIGKATTLLDLNEGRPHKTMRCPFSNPDALSPLIKDKDWTTYGGFHHTDHSIRAEFFDGRETPDLSRGRYFLDFSYIAGRTTEENIELMDGTIVDERLVQEDIGPVEEWRFAKPAAKASIRIPRGDEQRIAVALKHCKRWLQTKIYS